MTLRGGQLDPTSTHRGPSLFTIVAPKTFYSGSRTAIGESRADEETETKTLTGEPSAFNSGVAHPGARYYKYVTTRVPT